MRISRVAAAVAAGAATLLLTTTAPAAAVIDGTTDTTNSFPNVGGLQLLERRRVVRLLHRDAGGA